MPTGILSFEERIRLVNIVSKLYDFVEGPRTRRTFIDITAGLGRFIPYIDLTGNSRTISSDLIGRLENYGILTERQNYHALGALISAVLDLEEVSKEDARFLASLIVRHQLISDVSYLHNLILKYQIEAKFDAGSDLALSAKDKLAEEPKFITAESKFSNLERIINSQDNFLDIFTLYGGIKCAQYVGRVEDVNGEAIGTGFLINKNIFITNQHVIQKQAYLNELRVRFNYIYDPSGVSMQGRVLNIDPDFYYSSPADKLDYALIRLLNNEIISEENTNMSLKMKIINLKELINKEILSINQNVLGEISNSVESIYKESISYDQKITNNDLFQLIVPGVCDGFLHLAPRLIKENDRVNILQYPEGNPLKVVLTQNYVVMDMNECRVQYVADTMSGSSGSPVFNQKWEVVALHHSGGPYPPDNLSSSFYKVWKGRFRVNEGIPIRAILEDFKVNNLIRFLPNSDKII